VGQGAGPVGSPSQLCLIKVNYPSETPGFGISFSTWAPSAGAFGQWPCVNQEGVAVKRNKIPSIHVAG
jgi:hypothetical protein